MWIEHSQEKNEKKGLAKKHTRKEKKNMNLKQIFRTKNKYIYIYIFILATSRLAPAEGCRSQSDRHHLPRMHIENINFEDFKQHYSVQTKPLVSTNGLEWPQNDLGGCLDQAYHFQHQKLPLYAQSREPFRTNTQANKFLFALLV